MARGYLNQQSKREQGLRILLLMASLVIVVAGLKAAAAFFVPVLLSFFIATVSYPITVWLRERGVPKGLAVIATVLVDFAFLAGLVVIGITLVGDLQDKWDSRYKEESALKLLQAEDWAVGILERWEVEDARDKVRAYVTEDLGEQLGSIKVEDILDVSTNVVGRVSSFVGAAVVILLCTVFMLTDAQMFGRRLHLIAAARGPNFERILHAGKDIQRFLGIKTAISLATGLLAGFLCWAAGLDFFILWGILAYGLNYIPVMGSIIAGIPPTILALLVAGWPSAVAVGLGYCAINFVLGNFLEPLLMGHRFGMSTLVVIVVVMFWGWVWGPVGMFLAVPITMMLKVVLENSYEFRWLAVAISKETRGDPTEERELKEAVEAAQEAALPEGVAPEGGPSQ